jgi:hypothetical protein
MVHYTVHKNQPLVYLLSQKTPVHTSVSYLCTYLIDRLDSRLSIYIFKLPNGSLHDSKLCLFHHYHHDLCMIRLKYLFVYTLCVAVFPAFLRVSRICSTRSSVFHYLFWYLVFILYMCCRLFSSSTHNVLNTFFLMAVFHWQYNPQWVS